MTQDGRIQTDGPLAQAARLGRDAAGMASPDGLGISATNGGCAPGGSLHMAYADPPYIGQSKKHYRDHPDYAGEVDHGALIDRLLSEYPDGWALSISSPSTQVILGLLAERGLEQLRGDFRLMAWVKPFAAFKKNVRVAYAWEPLVVKPAIRLGGAIPTRDYIEQLEMIGMDLACREPITMRRGFTGAKPDRVCHWLFAAMGLRRTDRLDDLFPGSGAVGRAWEAWIGQLPVLA